MNKYFKLLLSIFISVLCSCNKDEISTNLEITLQNPVEGTIFISGGDMKYKRKVERNTSRVKDTLNLPYDGYYLISYGQASIQLYQNIGEDLKMKLDAEKFPSSTKFYGKNEEINSYLLEKELSDSTDYKLTEKKFLENLTSRKKYLKERIQDLPIKFREVEKKEIQYNYYTKIFLYPKIHRNLTNNQNFKVSDNYFGEIKNFKFDDTIAYQESQTRSYPSLTKFYYEWLARKKLSEYNGSHTLAFLSAVNQDFPKGKTKDDLFKFGLRLGLSLNDPIDKINNLVSKAVKDDIFRKEINEKYVSLSKLTKGRPAPHFKLASYNGDEVSLDDLKGRITYVDIWATWCGPCIAEIPALKNLQKKFPDVNFVSISIDRKSEIEKWKKMIRDKKLEDSYQLIAFQDKKFQNDYGINGIPRFILINRAGNLIDADAKRPSDPNIENQLSHLTK
ncbi:TlpA disulfide reductase family protein [uncultured Salegentibacter sp.]|uniref:TlpA family protein disulfide reductase n=1 Tax=uncultured Salegentibacter sp. TaxID=259320 RepID=UPI0030DD7DC4